MQTTETGQRIDISDHVSAICEAFGLELRFVKRIDLQNGTVSVEVWRSDEGGFYINTETGEADIETRVFTVKT